MQKTLNKQNPAHQQLSRLDLIRVSWNLINQICDPSLGAGSEEGHGCPSVTSEAAAVSCTAGAQCWCIPTLPSQMMSFLRMRCAVSSYCMFGTENRQ